MLRWGSRIYRQPLPSLAGAGGLSASPSSFFRGPCVVSYQGHCAPKRGSTANFDPLVRPSTSDGGRSREIGMIDKARPAGSAGSRCGTVISIKYYTLSKTSTSLRGPWDLP